RADPRLHRPRPLALRPPRGRQRRGAGHDDRALPPGRRRPAHRHRRDQRRQDDHRSDPGRALSRRAAARCGGVPVGGGAVSAEPTPLRLTRVPEPIARPLVVGVPKETKVNEYRVAVTPDGVSELVHHGVTVVVQAGAGAESAITDDEYHRAGAEIAATAEEVWE